MTIFRRLPKCSRGATAIEYGLLVALIALAIVAAAIALGLEIGLTFDQVAAGFPA